MPLYFISGNKNKFAEVKLIIPSVEMLDPKELNVDIKEIQSLDAKEVIEDKVKRVIELMKLTEPFIVEDTSLYLDAFNGKLPGPLVKSWVEGLGIEGIYKAAFNSYNVYAIAQTIIGHHSAGETHFFEGQLSGKLVPPTDKGFSWDSIFQP